MFSRINEGQKKNPGKMNVKGVLYDINSAEELISTKKKKDNYWSAVYKKKNGELFYVELVFEEDESIYIYYLNKNPEEIKEHIASHFSVKQYESIYGPVKE